MFIYIFYIPFLILSYYSFNIITCTVSNKLWVTDIPVCKLIREYNKNGAYEFNIRFSTKLWNDYNQLEELK